MRWSNSSIRPRPRSLARYIAASAWRTSSSALLFATVPDRNTDRRGEHHLVVVEEERGAQHLVDATGAVGDLVDVARFVAQHHELVAAEAGDGVGFARRRPEALGDLYEECVADGRDRGCRSRA